MNKRVKEKSLFIRNKKHPFYGMKRGTYEIALEDTNVHQEILSEVIIQSKKIRNQKIYLCRKKIGTQDYWWIATCKSKFKQIEVSREEAPLLQVIRRFYINLY